MKFVERLDIPVPLQGPGKHVPASFGVIASPVALPVIQVQGIQDQLAQLRNGAGAAVEAAKRIEPVGGWIPFGCEKLKPLVPPLRFDFNGVKEGGVALEVEDDYRVWSRQFVTLGFGTPHE